MARVCVRGVAGHVARAVIGWGQGGLICWAGGGRPGKPVAVEAPRRAPGPGWLPGTGDDDDAWTGSWLTGPARGGAARAALLRPPEGRAVALDGARDGAAR